MDDALKTRGNKYLNVETRLLFAPLPKFLATRLPRGHEFACSVVKRTTALCFIYN